MEENIFFGNERENLTKLNIENFYKIETKLAEALIADTDSDKIVLNTN